jgi:hypothetical protein
MYVSTGRYILNLVSCCKTGKAYCASENIIIPNTCRFPEVKRPLGRPRCRWVDNIKMNLREIGWDGGDWIGLAQDSDQWRALVNAVMNLRVP